MTAADGVTPEVQAGAHPAQFVSSFALNTRSLTNNPLQHIAVDGNMKDVSVALPPGLIGNPLATPKCSRAVFNLFGAANIFCPSDTQIGVVRLTITHFLGGVDTVEHAIYNVVPRPGDPADFGFTVDNGDVGVHLIPSVRTASDFGITTRLNNISDSVEVIATTVTFWGIPSDPSHDAQRACENAVPGCTSGAPRTAFLTNPSSCSGQLITTIAADSWQDPGVSSTATATSPTMTGCEKLRFNPSIAVVPDAPAAGAGTGAAIDIAIPQNDDPDGLATPPLKKAVVSLPVGFSISPSGATGLEGCSDSQLAAGSDDPVQCPDASKVGTVTVDTPLLADPMTGEVYVGSPLNQDSQTGQQFRMFLVLHGPGLLIKLKGSIVPDPDTGRITTTFDNNPQLPFSRLHLQFFGGAHAVLANPPTCGPATTDAYLTAWGKTSPVHVTSTFDVSADGHGAPCPSQQQFAPSQTAGTINPVAGVSTPFLLRFSREDADQTFGTVSVKLPPGLIGRISQAQTCASALADTGACPAGSLIGDVTTSAGAGVDPFVLTGGKAFLTDGYKGAPYGLAIVVHALAGPFDLGNIIVRSKILINPTSAQLTVVSDPIPAIVDGIPLLVRSVQVVVNRPKFMFNPTSCREMKVSTHFTSTQGTGADASNRFQVGECDRLAYQPRMSIQVGRAGHTGAGATVPLKVTLTQGKGQANNRIVAVTLPDVLNAKLPVLNHACSEKAFEAGNCSNAARIGSATAVTPVLPTPLHGTVYLVRRAGAPLPDLVVALRDPVAVNLRGFVKLPADGTIGTRFPTIPDVPIRKFTLQIVDGKQGPLGAAADLCSRAGRHAKAHVVFKGQNGATRTISQRLTVRGC